MSAASTSDLNQRAIFMNVPRTRPAAELSFEENRIHDYIKAYQTTGRPPQPTPQEPIDIAERARLGLPPLFEPYCETGGIPTPLDAQTLQRLQRQEPDEPLPSVDATVVPEVQLFAPTTLPTSDTDKSLQQFHSITLQPPYSGFSFEELRCRAYLAGKRFVPEAVGATPTPLAPVLPVTPAVSLEDSHERLQSITCQPAYSQHSFEELRLVHLRTRHELTSDVIIQHNVI